MWGEYAHYYDGPLEEHRTCETCGTVFFQLEESDRYICERCAAERL